MTEKQLFIVILNFFDLIFLLRPSKSIFRVSVTVYLSRAYYARAVIYAVENRYITIITLFSNK
jgi:hypothetical protein